MVNKKNKSKENKDKTEDTEKEAKRKLFEAQKRKAKDEEANTIKSNGITVYYDDLHGAVLDKNSNFYTIFVYQSPDKDDYEELKLRFTARGLKFLQFINYNGNILLNFELNGKEFTETIIDAKSLIAHDFALTPLDSKLLVQFLYQVYHDKKIPAIEKKDKIRIENGKIVVDKPEDYSEEKLKNIYKTLRDYYPFATKQITYLAVFGYSILSPFFTYIRKHSIKKIEFPQILLHGPTGGGKTTTADFFVRIGFDQDENMCFFNKNNVKSDFTMSKKLGLSYYPAIIDEVDENWLRSMFSFLKSYTQSISTASRGTPSQSLKEYQGTMAIIMTTNSSIRLDSDLAVFKTRLFDIEYSIIDTQRKNDKKFNDLILSLQPGFMHYILYDLMQGHDMDQLLKKILYFKKEDFVNYGLKKINESLKKFDIPEFPLFHEETDVQYTNAQEFIDKILSEDEKPNSFLYNEFKIEDCDDKIDIFFTGGCFKALNEHLRLPYNNATDFMSNIPHTGNIIICDGGKAKNKKISIYPKACFHITVLKDKRSKEKSDNNKPSDKKPENETSNVYSEYSKEENKPENDDIEKQKRELRSTIAQLPDGPVKEEYIEELEGITNEEEKQKEKEKVNKAEQKTKSSNESKKSGEIFFYKSEHDCIFDCVDSFDFGRYHYFKFDSSKIDMNSRDWNTWATHSMPIKEPEFERFKKYSIKYGGEKK